MKSCLEHDIDLENKIDENFDVVLDVSNLIWILKNTRAIE